MKLMDRLWASRWKAVIFPLSFSIGSLINIVLYYLGLAYQENAVRTYGFILGQLLFAGLCGLFLLATLKHVKPRRNGWLLLGAVLIFFFLNYALAFSKFGLHAAVVDNFIHFTCFALPAFFAGICGALCRLEKQFFHLMEQISFLLLPAVIIYNNGLLFCCNPFGYNRYFGIMGYMTFAYLLMPFLLAHILHFTDEEPLYLPLLKKNARRPQLIRGILIMSYWFAILGAGTRGTYCCVFGFCILFIFSKLIRHEPAKRAALLFAALMAVFLFLLLVYTPPGMYAISRTELFLSGLLDGQFITSVSKGLNREDLFRLSLEEFARAPITGMTANGFFVKYGKFPHNAILELLCECGLLFTVPFLVLIFFTVFRLQKAGNTDRNIRYLLLFFLAYAIYANISGTIWSSPYLLCALGYGLTLPPSGGGRQPDPSGISP